MKKLIQLLTVGILSTSITTSVVACGNDNSNIAPNHDAIDLKTLEIEGTYAQFNLQNNGITSMESLYQQAVRALNLSNTLIDTQALQLDIDVTVKIFQDKSTEITNFDEINNHDTVYIVFYKTANTKKVINPNSEYLSFTITHLQPTDAQYANEVASSIKKKTPISFNFDSKNEVITRDQIINKLNSDYVPKDITMDHFDTTNYNSKKVSFSGIDEDSYPLDKKEKDISVNILYNGKKSETTFLITIKGNIDLYVSKNLSKWSEEHNNLKNPLVLKYSEKKQIIAEDVEASILRMITDLQVDTSFKFENINFTQTDNLRNGQFTFQIRDTKTQNLLVYETSEGPQGNNFTIQWTTSILKNYQGLKKKFNDLDKQETSLSLQTITLANFIPGGAIDAFPKDNVQPIKDLLNSITLKNFIDWFFDPDGKYAKLMPRIMPELNSGGIADSSVNKELWTYINAIQKDLNDKHINNIDNGGLATTAYSTATGHFLFDFNVNVTTKIDLYNIIKGISPDLIHFHNYIINNRDKTNDNNYLLLFVKYLMDKTQDYSAGDNKVDGFTNINSDYGLKNNFDNLIFDLIDPFEWKNSENTKYDTKITPVSIDGTAYFKTTHINWKVLSEKQDPSDSIFTNILNTILKPEGGKSVLTPITATLEVNGVHIGGYSGVTVTQNFNIDFSSLHIMELKSLIKTKFELTGFENAKYKVKEGYLYLQGKQNDKWVDLHDLDAILISSDLRFDLRDINFTITSESDINIGLDYTLKNFYLNL